MDQMSKRLVFYAACIALIMILKSLTACGKSPQASALDAVSIEQTPIENQFSIGFCWSYATIGLIESNHKAKTGKSINLSEEALGYASMRHELLDIAKMYRSRQLSLQNAIDRISGDGLEGWYVRAGDQDPSRDAMELIDDYGLVPESEWSFKFESPKSVQSLKQAIQEPFKSILLNDEPINSDTIDQVLTVSGAFPSAPPSSIYFEDRRMTTQEFARSVVEFRSRDYVAVRARNASDSLRVIQLAKKALAAGYSVPMNFAVSFGNLRDGLFFAPNYSVTNLDADPILANTIINTQGGHAVLITDFVNIDGVEGAVSSAELTRQVNQPAENLRYFKFKNSWDVAASTNERGIRVNSASDGYYRMDLGYIKATASKGRFGIVIPRSLAL